MRGWVGPHSRAKPGAANGWLLGGLIPYGKHYTGLCSTYRKGPRAGVWCGLKILQLLSFQKHFEWHLGRWDLQMYCWGCCADLQMVSTPWTTEWTPEVKGACYQERGHWESNKNPKTTDTVYTPGGGRSLNIFRPCSHVGGKVEQKIDRQVGAGCAVIWMLGHLLCRRRSRVWRRRQWFIYVPTLTYGQELWLMTKRTTL